MKYPQLKLDTQLCHRLYIASNGVVRHYRPILESLDLTYPQYVVMMALWEQDDITVNQLVKKTAIDAGAMTLILKKLIDKQFLVLIKDEQDQRKRIVQLTKTGKNLQDQAADVPSKIVCKFPNMEAEELHQLINLLDKLNHNFIE